MKTVRVGILSCATGPKADYFYGGALSDLFVRIFQAASQRRSEPVDISFSTFDSMRSEFPDPIDVDAILITGSPASAYDTDSWVTDLANYTKHIYQNHPHIRIFGICFGHQLVAHILLADYGITVEKNPRDRQLGVRSINLNPTFCSTFPTLTPATKTMRLQVIHGDHVNSQQKELPPGWMVVGSSDCCDVHGLYEPDRVLTLQAHLEFDRDVCDRIIKGLFSPDQGYSTETYTKGLEQIEHPVDVDVAEDMALAFLVGAA